MKFAVGYQLQEESEESIVEVVRDYREHITEVYFPWIGMASGRAVLNARRGYVDWTAQQRLEDDLRAIRDLGLKLDLLFNGNCSVLAHLDETLGGADIVTTTSLAIARTVRRNFPRIDVRASVNMRLGTVHAMEYAKGLFTSYYVQRDVQRNLAHVQTLKAWADANAKGLCMLANSGCLRFCPGQTFHDNMVAHEQDIDETHNIEGWTPHVCWNLYRDKANWPAILQASWVRPEDLHHYETLFPVVKLATRMHTNPRLVVHAYTERRYRGNLLDLFEPGFGPIFAPCMLDNTKFPDDWFQHGAACSGPGCAYCQSVLNRILVRMGE